MKAAAVVGMFVLLWGGSASAADVNIFSGSSPVFAPLFVADAKGFFKAQGLDVSVRPFTSGADATEGFRAGAAQMLVACDVPLLYLVAGGDTTVLARFSANPEMLLVMGRKAISGPADLRGKKVGLVRKSASEYLLHLYLRKAGLSLADVELVHLAPFDQVPALARGDVDALSTWKPFDRKILELGGDRFRRLAWSGDVNYLMYCGIATKKDYARAQSGKVVAVLKALNQASRWIATAARPEINSVLAVYLKTTPEDVAYVIEKNDFALSNDAPFRKTLQEIEQFLAQQKLIGQRVSFGDAIDTALLRNVDPALVR
jgi:NitT/TauT family transport system substrate-binding protein